MLLALALSSWLRSLAAYKWGVPPNWCNTEAAAEAWALHVALLDSVTPPQLRTDCQRVLATAREVLHVLPNPLGR